MRRTVYSHVSATNDQDEESTKETRKSKSRFGLFKRSTTRPSRWTPYSLSTSSLIGLIILFSCLIIALIILRFYAHRHNGFTLITTNHYTWVYGPTAILVVIISFWRKVDYHCKALQPWLELSRGPLPADRTIILDHISPFLPVTLYNAIKMQHYAVIASIFGFLILQVITVASTGLLAPSNVTGVPTTVDLKYKSKFVNGTLPQISDGGSWKDQTSVYTTYAILNRGYQPPAGTGNNLIYETFEPVTPLPNTTYSANVHAFVPKVQCDPFELDVQYSVYSTDRYVTWITRNDSTWTCSRDSQSQTACKPQDQCPPRAFIPARSYGTCRRNTNNINDPYYMVVTDIEYQAWNQSFTNTTFGTVVDEDTWQLINPNSQSVMCEVIYTIEDVTVTYDASNTSLPTVIMNTKDSGLTLTGMPYSDISAMIHGSFQAASEYMFGGYFDYADTEQPPDALLKIVAERAGGDYATLLNDPEGMLKAAEDVMLQLVMQLGRTLLMEEDSSTLQGSQTRSQFRLQIEEFSLWIMVVGFILMILLTVGIILTNPARATISNPESISALAQSFARSDDMRTSIEKLGQYKEVEAHRCLSYDQYYTQLDSTGQQTIHSEKKVLKEPDHKFHRSWWSPMTLTIPFLALTNVVPLIIVIILEILQHASDSSQGIVTLQNNIGFVAALCTRFAPALIMLIVSALFGSFQFNASILAPFSKLKAKPSAFNILNVPLLSQLPPIALWTSFKHRHFTTCLVMIAGSIGSLLTIIVSGLYTIHEVPYGVSQTVQVTDRWNLSVPGVSINTVGTAALMSLVESVNLTYPAFTYDTMAFPTLSLSDSDIPASNDTGTLTIQVPALRGELNCTALTPDQYNRGMSVSDGSSMNITAKIPLPETCRRGSQFGNESFIDFTPPDDIYIKNQTSYFGWFMDIHVGPFDGGPRSNSRAYGEFVTSPQPDNPPSCPTIVIAYGSVKNNQTQGSPISISYCYQTIKKLDVNLTLSMPNLTISPQHPPIPDEGTAELVNSGPNNETGFPWRFQNDIEHAFRLINNVSLGFYPGEMDTGSPAVSTFFQGVIAGRTPIDVDTLTNNEDPETVFNHIQQFYGRYMAQVLSASMRVPINSTTQNRKRDDITVDYPTTLSGVYTPGAGSLRLIQNRTPKIVLQVMLGLMFACGLIAWIFGDLHEIVPWNPCTIAGTMVLFAGSRICPPAAKSEVQKVTANKTLLGGSSSGHVLNTQRQFSSRRHDETEDLDSSPDPQDLGQYSGHQPRLEDYDEEGDLSHISTSYSPVNTNEIEMRHLHSTPMRPGTSREESTTDVGFETDTETRSIPVTSDDNRLISSTSNFTTGVEPWNNPHIRLRLGWWKDGVFTRSRLPKVTKNKAKTRPGMESLRDNAVDEPMSSEADGLEYRIDTV